MKASWLATVVKSACLLSAAGFPFDRQMGEAAAEGFGLLHAPSEHLLFLRALRQQPVEEDEVPFLRRFPEAHPGPAIGDRADS